jgi:t-SNARE syntaxin family protein
MDPFIQVYKDAQTQLEETKRHLDKYEREPTNNHLMDVNNLTQELIETIHDLSQSIGAVQSKPSDFGLSEHEINDRIGKVSQLNRQLGDIQEKINEVKQQHQQSSVAQESGSGNYQDNDYAGGGVGSLMYQDAIQEQDTVLDSVYSTVNNLRQQANVMSRELEDQSYLIEDFERDADTAGDRLRRGMKRVNWVVKNNQETLSSCCITLLIVVLIILLVLVLIL